MIVVATEAERKIAESRWKNESYRFIDTDKQYEELTE